MIVNTLMFKLRENTIENIGAIREKLLGMEGNIPQLKEIDVRTNIREGGMAYDVLMIARYETMQDFEEYIMHPFHAGVGQYVREVSDQIASVCYEEYED